MTPDVALRNRSRLGDRAQRFESHAKDRRRNIRHVGLARRLAVALLSSGIRASCGGRHDAKTNALAAVRGFRRVGPAFPPRLPPPPPRRPPLPPKRPSA